MFPHVFPRRYLERIERIRPAEVRIPSVPALYDMDARFRIMDRFEGYVQVLTLSAPMIEDLAQDQAANDLARLANDAMAELVAAHPDRFLGFAASVSLLDVDAAIREVDRATSELGALGVQIFTNVRGHPLDVPRFEPFFAHMSALGRPIWVHPTRGADVPDYPTEDRSKYWIYIKLGWPYETAVFTSRLIFAGIMDRYPGLKILTHHAAGLVPHLAHRLTLGHETPENRARIGVDDRFTPERVIAAYQRFYGDTAFSGTHAALQCALSFFGSRRLVFGTDMPYGAEGGEAFVRESIAPVEQLPESERRAIFEDSPLEVLGLASASAARASA